MKKAVLFSLILLSLACNAEQNIYRTHETNMDITYLTTFAKKFGFNSNEGDLTSFLVKRFAELKYYTGLGKLSGFSLYSDQTTQAFKTNIPHHVFNCAISLSPHAASSFNTVQSFFGNLPHLWVFESSQIDLEKVLVNHKLSFFGTCTGMVMDLEQLAPYPYLSEVRVERISNSSDLTHWATILSQVNQLPKDLVESFARIVFNDPNSHSYFYLGFWNNVPVATSLCTIEEGVVALYSVTTLPEYRRKGIGYAVSYQPLADAKQAGAQAATLSSSELGKPIYTKIGFKEYCTYKVYGS